HRHGKVVGIACALPARQAQVAVATVDVGKIAKAGQQLRSRIGGARRRHTGEARRAGPHSFNRGRPEADFLDVDTRRQIFGHSCSSYREITKLTKLVWPGL